MQFQEIEGPDRAELGHLVVRQDEVERAGKPAHIVSFRFHPFPFGFEAGGAQAPHDQNGILGAVLDDKQVKRRGHGAASTYSPDFGGTFSRSQ